MPQARRGARGGARFAVSLSRRDRQGRFATAPSKHNRARPVPTFYRLLGIALLVATTNNFVWFALTFWAFLTTGSVISTSVMAGSGREERPEGQGEPDE